MDPELQFISNLKNASTFFKDVPSYQTQTISSRLKIVENDLKPSGVIPFTVGASLVTHNIELLKQETVKKIRTLLRSYARVDDVHNSNINELRKLRCEMDTFQTESQDLKDITMKRKSLFSNVSSRYYDYNGMRGLPFKTDWPPNHPNIKREIEILPNTVIDLDGPRKRSYYVKETTKFADEIEMLKKLVDASDFIENPKKITTGTNANKNELGKLLRTALRRLDAGDIPRNDKKEPLEDVVEITDSTGKPLTVIADPYAKFTSNQKDSIQTDSDMKNISPSIYSRRKRRRHIRYKPCDDLSQEVQE